MQLVPGDAVIAETKRLPVLVLSLGGTKFQLGGLTKDGTFFAGDEIHWRSHPLFRDFVEDTSVEPLCDALVKIMEQFLRERDMEPHDVGCFGIPFPGPVEDRLWFSNNLTNPFRRGVALKEELEGAFRRHFVNFPVASVRVIFDAQCDAGGELYHPCGRLKGFQGSAVVLNVATGIAAGFVHDGIILVGDAAFRSMVDLRYDGGAGQIGRHIWYDGPTRRWSYNFLPLGRTPKVDGTRMTERLSGPALAGRLLHRLGSLGLLNKEEWRHSSVPFITIESVFRSIASMDSDLKCEMISDTIRASTSPIATAVLVWANEQLVHYLNPDVAHLILEFRTEVAFEFAMALQAMCAAPGWAPYSTRIVLTGGIGIHFLAAGDQQNGPSFTDLIESQLPGSTIERSGLGDATERECYLFRYQNAGLSDTEGE